MHEFSTAQQILEAALATAKEHAATKIIGINLEIGSLTFLNPQQLRFSLKILSKDTIAEKAVVRIKTTPATVECRDCGYTGLAKYSGPELHLNPLLILQCPRCQSMNTEIVEGRSCNIKSIRIVRKQR
jgi:hydrogenase nickel incorporation protein HypA/HybF